MKGRPSKGFAFFGRTLDNSTVVFVNVCGHESIQPPVGHSGAPINEDYIDKYGVDNVQVPIAVGLPTEIKQTPQQHAEPKKKLVEEVSNNNDNNSDGAAPTARTKAAKAKTPPLKQLAIEVVVHKMITDRCRGVWSTGGTPQAFDEQVPPARKMLVFRIARLALDWVQREAGLMIQPDSVRLMFHTAYHQPVAAAAAADGGAGASGEGPGLPSPQEMLEFMKRMGAPSDDASMMMMHPQPPAASAKPVPAAQSKPSSSTLDGNPTSMLFSASNNNKQEEPTKKQKSMIQEVSSSSGNNNNNPAGESVIRRGFLNSPNVQLYPDSGSGEGVLPEGAGDPLGYMPKALRDKCKVVDARGMTPAEMQAAAEQAQRTPLPSQQKNAATSPPAPAAAAAAAPSQHAQQQQQKKTEQEDSQLKKGFLLGGENSAANKPGRAPSPVVAAAPAAASLLSEGATATRVQIQEIGSDNDDENNHNNNNSSKQSAPQSFSLLPAWKCSVAAGWALNSAKVDTTAITLVLAPPATGFSIADLDLEVVAAGVCGSAPPSSSDGTAKASTATQKCFSLGDLTGSSMKLSPGGFTVKQWNSLLEGANAAAATNVVVAPSLSAESEKRKLSFDPDAASAKFKKATKELTITLPLI